MDYEEVIERFKRTFAKNGVFEREEEPFFEKSSNQKIKYMTDLFDTFSRWSNVYLNGELETLKEYSIPKSVIDFYRYYEPKNIPMTNAGIYLCNLDRFKEENSSEGGGVLLKYGVVTIATTIGGELVCLDLNNMIDNEPRVVAFNNYECNFIEAFKSYDDVLEIEHLVATRFSEFICKLSGDEYDDIENYLDE